MKLRIISVDTLQLPKDLWAVVYGNPVEPILHSMYTRQVDALSTETKILGTFSGVRIVKVGFDE